MRLTQELSFAPRADKLRSRSAALSMESFRRRISQVKLSSATTALVFGLLLSMHPPIARAQPAPSNRDSYVRVQLNDGAVLFAGGADDNGKPIARATIYHPNWVAADAMGRSRKYASNARLRWSRSIGVCGK